MLSKVASVLSNIIRKIIPDSLVFAYFLTFIAFIMGIVLAHQGPIAMINYWGSGMWVFLSFAMEVCLLFVLGHVLAHAPLVKKGLQWVAGLPSSPGQAIILVAVLSVILQWINTFFALVATVILAREIAKKISGVDFPLLVAAAYAGVIVWDSGLSGVIPMTLSTPNNPFAKNLGVVPLSQTIFDPANLLMFGLVLITLPILFRFLLPRPEHTITISQQLLGEEEPEQESSSPSDSSNITFAERLNNSRLVTLFGGVLGILYIFLHFSNNKPLDFDVLNLILLSLSLILYPSPVKFIGSLKQAMPIAWGIMIQFPLYAGIMSMVTKSGLGPIITNWFLGISTRTTFAWFSFLASALIKMFVPSAGGEFAVEAPIMFGAAAKLGVPGAHTAMSIAWGNAWSNLIQPFFMIPLLAVARLELRQILGYLIIALIWTGIILSFGMLVLYRVFPL